ncbi:MAG: energy transducer TonB [Cytophagales bacterium]|nr:energy transducer TonB [Cytophagales bacterium]
MKTHIKCLHLLLAAMSAVIVLSCNREQADPALVLDEVFIPEGYHQIDHPSSKALAMLEELRLENPDDHFYYLERVDKKVGKSRDWVFPQNELKIEFVDFNMSEDRSKAPDLSGVIVKKIRGDWQKEEFVVYDQHPKPKNGMKVFYEYVNENLKYPLEAKNSGIQGKVFVEFVVDHAGKLTDVKAIKGIGGGCDEEAVRVVKEAPDWSPGKVMDLSVNVRMILPISYKLN